MKYLAVILCLISSVSWRLCSSSSTIPHSRIEKNNSISEQVKDDNRRALLWPNRKAKVCWLGATMKNIKERRWVQEAIERTWEASSSLKFTEWCDCKEASKSESDWIRVQIKDANPITYGFGANVGKNDPGMILNFTFENTAVLTTVLKDELQRRFRSQTTRPINEEERKIYIEAQAVHEFGHAIGFRHTTARNLCEFSCQFDHQAEDKNSIWVTPCDERSVMNYCNDTYLNSGFLSQFDIRAIQDFYPSELIPNDSIDIIYTTNRTTKKLKPLSEQQQQQQQEIKKVEKFAYVQIRSVAKKKLKYPIKSVDYAFHGPTFKNMSSSNKLGNFPIQLNKVWGNFTCQAKIHFSNGKYIIKTRYIYALTDKVEPSGIENAVYDAYGKSRHRID